MKTTKAVLFALFAVGLLITLNTKIGSVPPAGKFLNPFGGFWQNAESGNKDERTIEIPEVKGNVKILFDQHRIPHIFAQNDYDLYFTQGYVTAKDRLWQMDFQTRFAAGRLSEVVGEKALELDKYQRRLGMTFGAEKMIEALKRNPKIEAITQAYADGVNAYIHSLKPEDYPIEFKILDYKPEEWKTLNTALLLKLMSATLTSGSDELYMTNVLNKYGADVVKDLFPDYPFREDPVIPTGTKWNFKPLPIPEAPSVPDRTSYHKTKQKEEGIGSNNWAIAGSKSATGFPILANDPHLDLTLPAIWYQVQMTAPGVNVYGVSIPGAPCVIIGFNQQVAWGVTNVGADVLDWYSVQFKDNAKQEYWYNNKWNPLKKRIETISIRGGKTVQDTVLYTHHGPIVYLEKQKPENFAKVKNVPVGDALKWVAHLPSEDLNTFYLLNRAQNYDDYRKALTYYTAPAQNFVFASADNDIAITPNGYFPLKYKDQGKFILDGSLPQNDWHGRIPADQNPTVKNPPRGFVSSANQSSTDPSYPYYINWEFSGYERAKRINNRLTVMSKATADSLRILQNDAYSVLAENVLENLISSINPEKLNASEREALHIIKKWNRFFNASEIGASIFDIWNKDLFKRIWDDEFGSEQTPMRYPSRDRTVEMVLNEPDARWFDNIKTPHKETKEDDVLASFKLAVDSLERRFGPISKEWQWGNAKGSNVPHLAKIKGFGSEILKIGGSKYSVNALGESNGPSWRMVVALGKEPKGFGIFPGGQSGNPGSFYYNDMIGTWANGKLDELVFLHSPDEKPQQIKTHWIIQKK
ncbi:penicillin acylase family protein [Rubrolithibacter danxiaensis]|uniref:penicillin acylase family protein n=1 Tax=Rubrolithibacter danxiaensis TaxID=3390805 RepID=UPI003BF7DE78